MRAFVRYFNIVFIVAALVVAGLAATGLLKLPPSEAGDPLAQDSPPAGEVVFSPTRGLWSRSNPFRSIVRRSRTPRLACITV